MPPEDLARQADRRAGGRVEARLEASVHGFVQGVGYRIFVVRAAWRLGLVGWVANRPDGGVECVAEGPRDDLERFAAELQDGPSYAEVERVDVRWVTPSGRFTEFAIRAWAHPGD